MKKWIAAACLTSLSLTSGSVLADDKDKKTGQKKQTIETLCREVSKRLRSVKYKHCNTTGLQPSGLTSVLGRQLAIKEYPPVKGKQPKARVLLIGGTHGDELTSVSMAFLWMKKLDKYHSGLFHWRVIPSLNPDGLLKRPATRMNGAGVDINRNLPTPGWAEEAPRHWARRNFAERRYPGKTANSEPETKLLVREIREFKPDVIISIHAPLNVVDFDGPDVPPNRLANLKLRLLGTFPGSLGNYAGVQLDIPVVTVEVAHAWDLPKPRVIDKMWDDLVRWLIANSKHRRSVISGQIESADH